ncbi:MAG TPA: enoyl-CoA hydratase-related protein [Anaerolineales bacterium]|nr:enoyl-CoA hydratase-related protein [Anaerolineales bacterium]
MTGSLVLTEFHGPVGLMTFNRPEALNALSPPMLEAICEALELMDAAPEIRVAILTGGERVFAAGADIKVMAEASAQDMIALDTIRYWERLARIRKPVIAAVSGYAFGGGCELAMACDLIVASETARFAQSEIRVGIIPGAGGTQRLARALGPYRAMEMVLTGEPIDAAQAHAYGLANRVVPVERFLEEAFDLARTIAERPPVAVRLAKEALRQGIATTLREGLRNERRNFYLSFETEDHAEGMRAFLERRPPEFKGK